MKECKVTIRGKEYTMRHCIRARIICESILKRMWSLSTLTDQYTYMYSCILASGDKMNYDDFLDAMEENPAPMNVFQQFMKEVLEAEYQLTKKDNPEDPDAKAEKN